MSLSVRRRAARLIPALEGLRRHALAVEQAHARKIEAVHPAHRASARNLLHDLAVRQSDIRGLQNVLALLGLSRLGRAEAHTLASLNAVMSALNALAGSERPPRARRGQVGIADGVQ